MEAAAELPAWLRALEPLSVPVVVVLTVVAVWIERRRDAERRRRYDARMRASAYELAELLEGWMGIWPDWAHDGERAPRAGVVRFARTIAADGPAARRLARSLVEDAPAATDELAEAAREVFPRVVSFVRFMEGFAEEDEGATASEEFERSLATELGTYRGDFVGRAHRLLLFDSQIGEFLEHSRW